MPRVGHNTAKQIAALQPFVKDDSRINRNGRPKGFNEARKAAISMLAEVADSKDSLEITHFQAILTDWLNSNNFQKQKAALELAGFFVKTAEGLNMNIDLRSLTNSQLERLSAGEDVYSILLTK